MKLPGIGSPDESTDLQAELAAARTIRDGRAEVCPACEFLKWGTCPQCGRIAHTPDLVGVVAPTLDLERAAEAAERIRSVISEAGHRPPPLSICADIIAEAIRDAIAAEIESTDREGTG